MAKTKLKQSINITNPKVYYDYFLINEFIAGIKLMGTEIKSIRNRDVNLSEAYCYFKAPTELVVKNLHISPYKEGTYNNHHPLRDRILLLNKSELKKIQSAILEQGVTIVAVSIFINEKGLAKLKIAIAKGKKNYDKRESIKSKDIQRELSKLDI